MTKSLILILTSFIFLAGCSPFGGGKETRKLVANGLTPKTLYEKAEDMVDAGSLDQAIDLKTPSQPSLPLSHITL